MSGRRWLVSTSAAERISVAIRALDGTGTRVLVAPSRAVADELAWRRLEGGGTTGGIQRTTLALLASELATSALAREERAPLAETAARAVLAQVVDAALRDGELAWFGAVARLPGFVPSLQRTVEELRFAGISAEVLEGAGRERSEPAREGEGARETVLRRAHLRLLRNAGASSRGHRGGEERDIVLVELAGLCRRYEEELARWRLADRSWIFARAIELIGHATEADEVEPGDAGAQRLLDPWRGRPQVWVDVAVHSALERELFEGLVGLSDEVTVLVPDRDRQTMAAVERTLGEPVESLPMGPPANRLQRVQRSVFAPRIDAGEPPPAADDPSFDFFSAAGEGQESVEISRRILALAESGIPFDEMAVLVRQPTGYLPLLEDALARAGIPAYFARGSSRPDPSGRAFLALLACAAEDLSASRFAEFLSFDQLPLEDPSPVDEIAANGWSAAAESSEEDESNEAAGSAATEGEVPWVAPEGEQLVLKSLFEAGEADDDAERFRSASEERRDGAGEAPSETPRRMRAPGSWEKLIVDAAVVGGADRWRRRLRGLAAELERRLREIDEGEDARRAAVEGDLRRVEDLRAVALPLIGTLSDLPRGGTWAQWLDALEHLAVRALRFPRSVLRVLAQLRPMAEVRSVSLQQVQKALEEPLRYLEAEPPKRRAGRVYVGGIDLARGRSFRVIFVPGLAEGVFPARSCEDPLLLDADRLRLATDLRGTDGGGAAADPDHPLLPLAVQDTRLHRERLLLRLAVGAAAERLVVSYPRIDVMLGRARVPSFYALDLLRAAEGSLPDLEGLAGRAAASTSAGVAWPAPADPEQAIDDAEFDLSLLHPAQQEAGAARFLLSANPHLERSLHSRARRWRRPFTWADGLVLEEGEEGPGDAVREILDRQRPVQRSFSPTALQHFAACPYRFHLQAIHRLRAKEDRTGFEQLDPLTRGSLFHEVQFLLFRRLRDEDRLPVRSDDLGEVLDIADDVLDEVANRTREEMAPAIDRIWYSEIDSLRNDLRGWLRQVADSPHWKPVMAELAFGLPADAEHDEASVTEPVSVEGGYLLRGSIDLVELGRGPGGPRLRVTDYKTGKARAGPGVVIGGGAILQPVLYSLVAERLLAEGHLDHLVEADVGAEDDAASTVFSDPGEGRAGPGGMRVESGRLYYCTVKGGFSEAEVRLNREARDAAAELLETVDDHLRRGFLPAAPGEGECRFCDYRAVCGPYEERRVARKRQDRLDDLLRLRRRR